jgi:hypothetical protein
MKKTNTKPLMMIILIVMMTSFTMKGVSQTPLTYLMIPVPSAKYIKETTLVDISTLVAGSFYQQISSKDLNISFYDTYGESTLSMQKLKAKAPLYGWNSNWNRLPFVENTQPEVLYTSDTRGEFTMVLSKPCTEFGFELAPIIKNKNTNFRVEYGTSNGDNSSGFIETITTFNPSGSRLFALKSIRPFTTITVKWKDYAYAYDYEPKGSAIANLRYKLAK